jgi:hypothetical protein
MRQITVTHRAGPADPRIAEPLCGNPDLALPEIGIKISVAQIYRNLVFNDDP